MFFLQLNIISDEVFVRGLLAVKVNFLMRELYIVDVFIYLCLKKWGKKLTDILGILDVIH